MAMRSSVVTTAASRRPAWTHDGGTSSADALAAPPGR